jgi:AraC family transcriptional regulator
VTPQAARAPGVALAACPRVSFHIELKGGTDMDYSIIEKAAFDVAVTTRRFTTENEQNFKDIPKWWQEFLASPDWEKMLSLNGNALGKVTGSTTLGICFADDKPADFAYGIAVELPAGAAAGPFEKKNIPAATWAVFPCALGNLQDITRRIFSEWLPSVPFEHAEKPELEVYLPGPSGADMKVEIWIPVVRKS